MKTAHSLVIVDGKRFVRENSTGEIVGEVQETFNLTQRREKITGLQEFVIVTQAAAKELAKRRLTSTEYSVLLYCFSLLDFENWIFLNQSVCGETLGMQGSLVSAVVKRLREIGFLQKLDRPGGVHMYRLSPRIAWRGSLANLKKYCGKEMTTNGEKLSRDVSSSVATLQENQSRLDETLVKLQVQGERIAREVAVAHGHVSRRNPIS